ncbi:Uncharacterized protein FWK35_00025206 [Aphis craccivora]|uniref:MULE domain-containing protein n=1 Tax=Aphis craccivora TaxID=307492 RepID=A0A6G0X0E2_APHCR|nr:Uncharacterized protein FWK35_00025206 [Aphis craccivora]
MCYSEVLNQINILKPNLQPKAIVMDFEQAFIKSFKELYSDVTVATCSDILYPWIGRLTSGGRRRAPTFPIKIWNMFDAVMQGSPRTNNAVDGWHRAFNSALGANHVTV